MKTGIIIIFRNNEKEIDKQLLVDYLNKAKHIEICLVNNDSIDQTYQFLKEIKEYCESVSIVNIKKNKTDISAVRAGVRYMINQFNLRNIGYMYANCFNYRKDEFNNVIRLLIENQDTFANFEDQSHQDTGIKNAFYHKQFSLLDHLKKFIGNNEILNFQG